MTNLKAILIGSVLLISSYSEACLQYKLCCREVFGSIECIAKCKTEFCPLDFPKEVTDLD